MYKRSGGLVVFSYDRDELFGACSLRSAYLSRGLKDKDGNYAGEDFVLTEDERDAFDECLKECTSSIFGVLGKMCPEGGDSLDGEEDVVFKAKEGSCGERDVKIVDVKFLDALIYGVLMGWFGLCGDMKLAEVCRNGFDEGCKGVWSCMFRMRERGYK